MEKAKESPKKDRHSNSGLPGGPKKGGAGGKGTWGKGGIDDLAEVSIGPEDPNYDSDEEALEENVVVMKGVEVISPIEAIIKDYLAESDISETSKSLKEVKNISFPDFVRKSMVQSMEKQPYEREHISRLLSAVYSTVIPPEQIVEGFQQTMDVLEDVVLDSPAAVEMLAKFLARAIVDEIVPPAFLHTAFAESPLSKEVLALAHGLVNDPHRSKKLEHIWGPGDLVSVKRLKEESDLLIKEYLSSGDLKEAERCIRKLNAPSFHSQVVKHAVKVALQKNEDQRKKILALLSFFSTPKGTGVVTPDHMSQGFKMCQGALEDIKLDVPNAKQLFDECTQTAKTDGWLTV